MAFAQSSAAPASSSNYEKAVGFINLYLPAKDAGKRRKLGAIALKASKAQEQALFDWLNEDPANAAKLATKLVVEFQSAAVNEAHGFDLS